VSATVNSRSDSCSASPVLCYRRFLFLMKKGEFWLYRIDNCQPIANNNVTVDDARKTNGCTKFGAGPSMRDFGIKDEFN